jgi:hypothetical protein
MSAYLFETPLAYGTARVFEVVINTTGEAPCLHFAKSLSAIRTARHQMIAHTGEAQRAKLGAALITNRATWPVHNVVYCDRYGAEDRMDCIGNAA